MLILFPKLLFATVAFAAPEGEMERHNAYERQSYDAEIIEVAPLRELSASDVCHYSQIYE